MNYIVLLLAWIAFTSCKSTDGNQSSSSTNWLTCTRSSDCAAVAGAMCTDGYCVDEDGKRLVSDDTATDADDAPANDDPLGDDSTGADQASDSSPPSSSDGDSSDDQARPPATDSGTTNKPTDDTLADDATNGDETTNGDDTTEPVTTDVTDDAGSSTSNADSGWSETSPGTVTIRLEVPAGQYCDPPPYCDGIRGHISIARVDDAKPLRPPTTPPCGYTPCSTCEPPACVGAACLPTSREVNNESIRWDGAYQEPGSCGADVSCHSPRFASAGRYLARMCATPGQVVEGEPDANGETATCASSGPIECVDVQFDLPSAEPVIGVLPSQPDDDMEPPADTECVVAADCTIAGLECCEGRCVNVGNDPFNCGACGVQCEGETPFCSGTCQPSACTETCGQGQLCCLQMAGPGSVGCADPIAGTCPVGCPQCDCASPDTLIATPAGEVPIADLVEGDLVYSIENEGVVVVPIVLLKRATVEQHQVVEVQLENGRTLQISAGHPTADGRTFGDLIGSPRLNEVAIQHAQYVPYRHPFTHDILPASSTGYYFANGVAIGSTLLGAR